MTVTALILLVDGAEEMETVITADVLRRAEGRSGVTDGRESLGLETLEQRRKDHRFSLLVRILADEEQHEAFCSAYEELTNSRIDTTMTTRAAARVTIAGVSGPMAVRCSRDVLIVPDVALAAVSNMVKFDLVIIPGGTAKSGELLSQSSLVKEVLTEQERDGRLIGAICAGPLVFIHHGIAKGKTVTSYPAMQAAMEEAGYKYSTDRVCIDGNIITSRGPGTATEFAFACASAALGTDFKAEHGPAMLINF